MNNQSIDKELTPKQAKFVDEYLKDLNATQAAIRAGYSKRSANNIGPGNLLKSIIQEAIQKRRLKLQQKLHITQERVLEEEARIAFMDVKSLFDEKGDLLPVDKIPEDARRAIAGIEVTDRIVLGEQKKGEKVRDVKRKYRLWDKGRALERISKHLGIYAPEKYEHTMSEKMMSFMAKMKHKEKHGASGIKDN